MCGIVGYVGKEIAKPILLDGLSCLEYRGYDSAGLALSSRGADFVVRRAVGPVDELVKASKADGATEKTGIAHTRWATHGVPTEINAHPHRAGKVVLVHNGIIENHAEIRSKLESAGVSFQSQTDTEVFARLIETYRHEMASDLDFEWSKLDSETKRTIVLKALQKAMTEVEGHYAILFMVQGAEEFIFGAQNGAPLVLSRTNHGTLIASDIQAILPHEKKVTFVPLHTVFAAQADGFNFYDSTTLTPVTPTTEVIEWSADRVAKDGYESFMLKEVFQQPLVVADTMSGRLPKNEDMGFIWDHAKAHEALWKNINKLYLVACGTSYHVAMIAKYFFEKWAGLPTEVDLASEFRYRNPLLEPGALVGVISQSGETADTLGALRLANERGVTTFSVCNVPGSTMARESGFQYPTKAGPEIGVASTKAFTSQVTVFCALAQDVARLRRRKRVTDGRGNDFDNFNALARLPHDIDRVLEQAERFKEVGASLKARSKTFFLGRGPMYPIALEGALKFKEITYHHSEGYAAGELKHGPIAMVDNDMTAIIIAPPDEVQAKVLSNLQEMKSRGAYIVGVGEEGDKAFEKLCDVYLPMPQVKWGVAPMIYVIPLQLIAYGLAKALDRNIDKPRNLAKSVTVE